MKKLIFLIYKKKKNKIYFFKKKKKKKKKKKHHAPTIKQTITNAPTITNYQKNIFFLLNTTASTHPKNLN